MSAPQALSVTELNRRVHSVLEERFAEVWVAGEVSDPRAYPSGHTYFKLKDAESQLSAVLFKGAAAGLRFTLEHGLAVTVRGRVSSYVKRGEVQLIVDRVEPAGAGALQLAFEQLKAKLTSEGLFDESRKKPLPAFPGRIGVVTSSAGAAVTEAASRPPRPSTSASRAALSGTTSSAAAEGVGARRSATKSAMVKSVSWPTQETTGMREAAMARATGSSLNAQRSSREPPPRPTRRTSVSG